MNTLKIFSENGDEKPEFQKEAHVLYNNLVELETAILTIFGKKFWKD